MAKELEQAVAATEAFLAQMRREHIQRHGIDEAVRVPVLATLSPDDRLILLRSMRAALKAAETAEKAI